MGTGHDEGGCKSAAGGGLWEAREDVQAELARTSATRAYSLSPGLPSLSGSISKGEETLQGRLSRGGGVECGSQRTVQAGQGHQRRYVEVLPHRNVHMAFGKEDGGEADDEADLPEIEEGEKEEDEKEKEEREKEDKEEGEEPQDEKEEEKRAKEACGPPRPLKVIVMVVPLPDKRGKTVMEGIQHLYIKLKRQGYPIQRLHSDRGKEFLNHGLRRWCLVREVEKTTTSADSPQENGRAEACIGSLKSKIRRLLKGAELAVKFWPMAARYAVVAEEKRLKGERMVALWRRGVGSKEVLEEAAGSVWADP